MELSERCKLLGKVMPNGTNLEIVSSILTMIVTEHTDNIDFWSENFEVASQSFAEGFQSNEKINS